MHDTLKLWLKVCSQTFNLIESLPETLHVNFQGQIETLHVNFQGWIASLHANLQGFLESLQSNFQSLYLLQLKNK